MLSCGNSAVLWIFKYHFKKKKVPYILLAVLKNILMQNNLKCSCQNGQMANQNYLANDIIKIWQYLDILGVATKFSLYL